ncbi:MAG: M48 family metalloprotease [Alphaproteobacteria bacterium]
MTSKQSALPAPAEVISTLLLAAAGALALSSLLNLFPYQLAVRAWHKPLAWFEWPMLISAGGALLWAPLAFLAIRWSRLRSDATRLLGAVSLDLTADPELYFVADRVDGLAGGVEITFLLQGDPAGVNDTGGPLILSPYAVQAVSPSRRRLMVVVIPAALWVRFRRHPSALGAVLAHEVAHLINRDLDLLFGIRQLLLGIITVAIPATLLAVVGSTLSDSVTYGWEWQALGAAIVGKIYLVSNSFLVIAMSALVRRLEIWREALADFAAVGLFGDEALAEAERLAGGLDAAADTAARSRPGPWRRVRAVVASPPELLLYGFIVAAVADYLSGPFAYLGEFGVRDQQARNLLMMAGPVVSRFVWFAGFLLPIRALLRHLGSASGSLGRQASSGMLLLVLGAILGHLCLVVLPLLVTSVAMPSRYNFIMRHDPGPLLLAGLASVAATAGNYAIFGGLCAWLTIRRKSLWLALCPGAIWAVCAALEIAFASRLADGALSVLIALLVLVVIAIVARPPLGNWKPSSAAPLALVMVLTAAGWLGYGDKSHLAAAASEAGHERWLADDRHGAMISYRRAAERAPLYAAGWLRLALVAVEEGDVAASIEMSERALHAPYLSNWQERLEVLSVAASAQLQAAAEANLHMAARYLAQAEWLWRHDSRLNQCDVATVLYNSAAVDARLRREAPVAMLHLAEAALLDESLALDAMNDPDFVTLALAALPPPNKRTLQVLSGLSDKTVQGLSGAVAQGAISGDELVRFLGAELRQQAQTKSAGAARACEAS